jgi:hypothetical protein
MNMRLLGTTSLSEITPDLVDASRLRTGVTPQDNLYSATCKFFSYLPFTIVTRWTQMNRFVWLSSENRSCNPLV